MVEDAGKKVTVRVPEVVHEPARIKVARLDTSFQHVLLELLREWAIGKTEVVKPPERAPEQPHREEMELLGYILEHGSKDDVAWIKGNLKTFVEAIHARPEKKPSASGGGRRAGK